MIGSKINYRNTLVTPKGDVHYTGETDLGGDFSGGDSFYRVVYGPDACDGAKGGQLVEITRDWWNYVFEPDINDKVVFYGPDPTEDGTPNWDRACIFSFDGCLSDDNRYKKLVSCRGDWWQYVESGPDTTTSANDTERERCEEQFYTLRGDGVPSKIVGLDRNGDGTEEVCLDGEFHYKKKGTWKCNICIDSGTGHCENSAGMLTGDTTQATCTATSGNTWSTTGECYNDITTTACTITQPSGWKLNNDWCDDPGSSWATQYSGLACLKDDKSVELISSTSEAVANAWKVGKRLIYSAVADGEYCLNAVSFNSSGTATVTELTCGIELYEVAKDPADGKDGLLVNGLRFSDNSYVFGTYDFTSGKLDLNTALTGIIDTMIILGD